MNGVKDHLENFLLISVVFIVSCSLTLGFVLPLQTLLLSDSRLEIGLLFLPHGVRLLVFYFYGWKGILYLLPSSYLFMILTNKTGAELDVLSPLVSMVACYIGYYIATLFAPNLPKRPSVTKWQFFIFAGTLSSIINGLSLSLLQFQDDLIVSSLSYLIGDVTGLVVCFFMLIYAFRLVRMASFTERD